MKTSFYVTILSCFFAITCYSQNYKEGYIISLDGDTVRGMIDFQTDIQNSKECKFRESENSQVRKYLPFDISGYRFLNEKKYYVPKNIELEGVQQHVFLEYLVDGRMKLYYHNDGTQLYYLFEKESGEMNILTKREDRVDSKRKIIPDNRYIGIIKYTFRDHPAITAEADKIRFDHKSMIRIAKQYNDEVYASVDESVVFQEEEPAKYGALVKFSVYSGVQFVTYTFNFRPNNDIAISGIAPTIGAEVNLSNPRWSNLLALEFDLSFSRIDKESTVKIPPSNTGSGNFIEYSFNIFAARLGLNFVVPVKGKFTPTISAGLSYIKLMNSSANDGYYKMKDRYYSVYGMAGLNYNIKKKQSVFLRCGYDWFIEGNDFTQPNDDRLRIVSLNLGYVF